MKPKRKKEKEPLVNMNDIAEAMRQFADFTGRGPKTTPQPKKQKGKTLEQK